MLCHPTYNISRLLPVFADPNWLKTSCKSVQLLLIYNVDLYESFSDLKLE